jgi:hypothetical protein
MNTYIKVIIVLFVVLLSYWLWRKYVKSSEMPGIDKNLNLNPFVPCDCNIATSHPNMVKHKSECSKFWKLNPGRTGMELYITEGLGPKKYYNTDGSLKFHELIHF